MNDLWQTDTMIEAMGARPVGNLPSDVPDISIDTRSLSKGEAYFAIKGDIHDGHAFIGAAQTAGAGLAVVSGEKLADAGQTTLPLLVVDDVLQALEQLGKAARARSRAKIIAVTGSVGKTSTKETLRTMLSASGKVHFSIASFNNHWGVPLTLARMAQDCEFGVFEIGMNHPGEITPLVKMVEPHIAIITNVEAAHLGAFSSVEDIARAKAEIFSGIVSGGTAVLNRDNEYFDLLSVLARESGIENIITFGEHKNCDVFLEKVKLHDVCSCAMVSLMGEDTAIKIGVPGRHVVQNVLAAMAAVRLADADVAKAVLALGDMRPEKGRGTRYKLVLDKLAVTSETITLIDESYNANPASMRAAIAMLEVSQPGKRGRRIAVLGDMLELGAQAGDMHAALAEPLIEAAIDQIFLVGPEMKHLGEALPATMLASYVPDVAKLKPILFSSLRAGDVVMAKASKGIGFAGLIEDLVAKYERV